MQYQHVFHIAHLSHLNFKPLSHCRESLTPELGICRLFIISPTNNYQKEQGAVYESFHKRKSFYTLKSVAPFRIILLFPFKSFLSFCNKQIITVYSRILWIPESCLECQTNAEF